MIQRTGSGPHELGAPHRDLVQIANELLPLSAFPLEALAERDRDRFRPVLAGQCGEVSRQPAGVLALDGQSHALISGVCREHSALSAAAGSPGAKPRSREFPTVTTSERGGMGALVAALVAASTLACGAAEIPRVSAADMEPAVARAIAAATTTVEREPGDAAAWGRLGMVLHAHSLPKEAADAYVEAARLDDSDHRWTHLHARLLETEAPEAALVLAEETLHRRAHFPPALALRARLLEALGEDEAAGAAWVALAAAAPNSGEAALALARRLLERGDIEGARERLERLTGRIPDSAAGWSFLAQIHRRLDQPERAQEAARRARLGASSPSRGATGDPDPLLEAVAERRADAVGREARARRAAESGDVEAAAALYRDLSRERPDDAELRYNLGNALSRLGRSAEAEAAYREALARDPDSSPAMANLANLLARSGREEEAGHLYRRSAESDPSHLPTLLGASSLAFQRGDLRDAERLLRRALAEDPTHPAALQGLGQLLATGGRLDEASAVLARALDAAAGESRGQRAGIHFLLADVERQRGRLGEARSHLDRAESLGMDIPEAFRALLNPD